jgi:hypothetical protein
MEDVLRVLLLALGLIALSHGVFARYPHFRTRVTRFILWKAQFHLHPLLILVWLWPFRDVVSGGSAPRGLPAWLLVPTVFNWGVEPWNLPRGDIVFMALFYMHHAAPVVASVVLNAGVLDSRLGSGNEPALFSAVLRWQAVLFAHAWALHPIGALDAKGIIDKQRLFWPYMAQGLLVKGLWWRSVLGAVPLSSSVPSMLVVLCGPILLQYVGRLGLYWRLCALQNRQAAPGEPPFASLDPFETRKQWAEPAAFLLALILAVVAPAGGSEDTAMGVIGK